MSSRLSNRALLGVLVAALALGMTVMPARVSADDEPRAVAPTAPSAAEVQSHLGDPAPTAASPPSGDTGAVAPSRDPAVPPARDDTPDAGAPIGEAEAEVPDGRAADDLCAPDPTGDTFREGSGGDVPVDEPRADLVAFCASYDDELRLEMEVAEPTDPASNPGWEHGTALYWFIDTDGDGYDQAVVYTAPEGDARAEVVRIDADGSEESLCDGEAAYRDGRYLVAGIDSDECLIDPGGRLDVAAISMYATTDHVAMDVSDAFIAVGRSGADPARQVDRLAGNDRIATAVDIAQRAFPQSADTVYLATADRFPDALSAGPLEDGPTLLVPSCGQLPGPVAQEIARLEPSTVVGLGGGGAVCDALLGQAAGEVQAATDRLAGAGDDANRFGTSAAISRRAFPDGARDVYVATGEVFPDALTAGSLTDGPILLVPSCGALPEVIADEIARTGADRVLALGGDSAVCDRMLDEAVAASGGSGDRLAGDTRFDTAAAIARFQFPDGAETVYLARSDEFPDALAAGSLTDGPVVLVPSCGDIPVVIANAIRALDPDAVTALGGDGAVCDDMLRHAGNA